MKRVSLAFLCGIVGALSCDETNEPDPAIFAYDYLPLKLGAYQTYDVNETTYGTSDDPLAEFYQLKTEVTDSIPNAQGNTSWVVTVTRRNSLSEEWQPLETWVVRIDGRQAIATVDNVPYQLLSFPPAAGTAWDGNRPNSLEPDEYEITSADQPFTISGGLSFAEVVTVLQEDNQDVIVQLDFRRERYARGVGLVTKEVTLLTYCTQPSCLGQQIIESGREYTQQIVDYGGL